MKSFFTFNILALVACVHGGLVKPKADVTCPEDTDDGFPTFLPSTTNCEEYYVCVHGEPSLHSCPDGLWFDPSVNVCNWPDVVGNRCPAACLEPWTLVPESKCYLAGKEKMPFTDAANFCAENGGILAEPRSKEESQAINGFISKGWQYWIGLTDLSEEGRFVWESDKSAPTFDHWKRGEPNNFGDEDCVHLRYVNKFWKGSWSDLKCSRDQTGIFTGPVTALCQR